MASQAVFAGMPDEGLAFLEDLEERNTKEFFDANKQVFREQVQAPFAALLDAAAGQELARILRRAAGKGMETWLDPLQRMPKPYPADHPRAELLRARSLTLGRQRERGPWLLTGELLDHLVEDWRALVPLNRWLERLPEP